jgi:hypothetical protein
MGILQKVTKGTKKSRRGGRRQKDDEPKTKDTGSFSAYSGCSAVKIGVFGLFKSV